MTVSVAISPAPFTREPVHLDQPEGRTVRSMLVDAVKAGAIDPNDFGRTTIYVDGEALDHDDALDHVLRAGQVVNVAVEAHGGGGRGRKDVGQILLTIAVVAVSAWVGGGAGGMLLFKSAMLQQVAAATVLTLGQAAVAAIFAPDAAGQAKANDHYALQSASNQYRPWAPFPLALGEVHVAPDLAVKTFTQARGDDVWIYGILAPHFGPCTIDELKIGDTLVSSMGSADVQIVQHLTPGPRTFTLVPNDIDQADFQEELEATQYSATPVVRAAGAEGERFEFDFFLPGGLHFQKDDGRVLAASVTVQIRYRAIDEDGDPVGAGSWSNGTTLPLSSTTKEPWRVMASLSLPLGRYEFQIMRSIKPDANEKRHDDIGLTAIRAIAFRKPVTDETLSLIEFAVRATALNQGTLAPITCRVTPIAQTWNGTSWGAPQPTSNPAALVRWLMTGPAAARPLDPSEADLGLRAWSALCDEYDWTSHIHLLDDRRQSDALALLEQAGRASLFHDGTQLVAACWVEKPAPVQLFTGANLRDHRWSIVYPEPVHALRVEFQNLDQAGEPDELYVYADGYGAVAGEGIAAATLVEAFRLEGQKTQDRAYRDGRWELGRRLHQRRIDTWTADAEHVVSRYGQRVRLAWLRVDGGQGVRVRCRRTAGGQVIGLRLNQPVTFIAGETYALDLRLDDQLLAAAPIQNPAVDEPVSTREILFAAPRAAGVSPKGGDMVAFGTPDRISEDVEIIGMTPGEDLSCVITGVRYVAPLLMAGETGPIPPLQTRLTRQRSEDPPAPTLLGVQVDAHGVRVGFGMPPWRGSPITGFSARWRPTPEGAGRSGWVGLPELGAGEMILTTPPLRELPIEGDDLTKVDIEIRAMTASGRVSEPLAVTVEQPVVTTPGVDSWTVVALPANADGTQQPGLLVNGAAVDPRTASITVQYLPVEYDGAEPPAVVPLPIESEDPDGFAALEWTTAYSGPPMRVEVVGLQPVKAYWVAVGERSAQGVPGRRTVYGPSLTGPLVAGDTTHVGGRPVAEIPGLDTVPPGVPTGLTLSSSSVTDSAGNPYARIAAEWVAPVDLDLAGYDVEVTESGFTVVERVSTAAWGREALTGRSYAIRARAVDLAGNVSDWTAASSVVGAGDTTPPAVPTGFTVGASFGAFFLGWTNAGASDLAQVEVWENTTNNSGTATRIATVNAQPSAAGSYTRAGLTSGANRYFWLKSVDTSGNVSGFSAVASGTIPSLPGPDTTPPGVPTGLSLSTSSVISASTGLPVTRVVATWTANGESDLARYDIEWIEGAGSPVVRPVGAARDEIANAIAGLVYRARIRAVDVDGNASAYGSQVTITAAADSLAPGSVTGLAGVASLGSIFLTATGPGDGDLAVVEFWENTSNTLTGASLIGRVNCAPGGVARFTRSGLSSGVSRWHFARAVDTSGNAGGMTSGVLTTVPYAGTGDFQVNSLSGNVLQANTVLGNRLVGESVEGSVFVTTTSLPGTIRVGDTGVTIATVEGRASDPAARINANTTLIGPGRIQLSGSTTLTSWQHGGDTTLLNGGVVAANTLRANSAEIGLRGVTFDRFNFTTSGNTLSWTVGRVAYTNDAGTVIAGDVAAGSYAYTSVGGDATFIYWVKDASTLSTTKSAAVARGANAVHVATYYGSTLITATYGRTMIDGDFVKTDTLETRHLKARQITTLLLAADAVTAYELAADAVLARNVAAQNITMDKLATSGSIPATLTLGSTGLTVQTTASYANDPAARINGASTLVEAGRIRLTGATALSSWLHGADQTLIDGGAMAANTLDLNKLKVGARGVSFDRFNFTTSGNTLSWTTGRVIYVNDAGTVIAGDVSSGSYNYTASGGDVTYVYWVKDASTLSTTKSSAVAMGTNAVVVGAYYGSNLFTATYGRTVIDGDFIKNLAIQTVHLAAGSVTAAKISVTDLSAISAALGTVTTGLLRNTVGTFAVNADLGVLVNFTGSYMKVIGSGFGASSNLDEWYGPKPSGATLADPKLSTLTTTNGAWAMAGGTIYYGSAPLDPGGGGGDLTVNTNFGQTVGGSGYNSISGSSWQVLAQATLTSVVSGQLISASLDWGLVSTSGGAFNGEVRLRQGASTVLGGPDALSLVALGSNDPINYQATASATGTVTYYLEARQTSGATLDGSSGGAFSFSRYAIATTSQAGMMSPAQVAALEAGGGGGGVSLASTAPATLGTSNAVGTGTTAARDDHVHAHGSQAGGSLHAVATTSGAGFMSAAQVVRLDSAFTQGMTSAAVVGGGSIGAVALVPGNGTNSGYISFRAPTTGTEIAYIGYGVSGTILVQGAAVEFSHTPRVGSNTVYHAGNLTPVGVATSGTPASLGTASRGTSADAARADHVHAHGNQSGGSLHSEATTSTAGFLGASDKTKLNNATPNSTANALVQRNSNKQIAVDTVFADTAVNIGFREMAANSTNIGFNCSIYATSFVPTSDLTLKTNVQAADDVDALGRVCRIELISFDWIETGEADRGMAAQALKVIDPLYVRGGDPKTKTVAIEAPGPTQPGEIAPRGEIELPVIDPATGEQETNPLGLNTTALLADALAAIRVLAAREVALNATVEALASRLAALEAA